MDGHYDRHLHICCNGFRHLFRNQILQRHVHRDDVEVGFWNHCNDPDDLSPETLELDADGQDRFIEAD